MKRTGLKKLDFEIYTRYSSWSFTDNQHHVAIFAVLISIVGSYPNKKISKVLDKVLLKLVGRYANQS